jgi:hypothetical protein
MFPQQSHRTEKDGKKEEVVFQCYFEFSRAAPFYLE